MKYRQSWLGPAELWIHVDSQETHISFQAGEEMLVRYPRIREPTNLLTSILGLRFYIGSQHMRVRPLQFLLSSLCFTKVINTFIYCWQGLGTTKKLAFQRSHLGF